MDMVKINDIICFNRKKQGLTQEQLAVKLGVTNQSVSKWESAQCCPDISLIPKLADILKISIDELFGREPSVDNISQQITWSDDDVFRVVVTKGKKVLSVDELDKTIEISFPKNCNETTRQYFKVEVFGNLYCDASINGDVICRGMIECNCINGDIKECSENISCQGNINGDVICRGMIECNCINSDVKECSENISCQGNINGDVVCGGNIECKTIDGDIICQGNIIYK